MARVIVFYNHKGGVSKTTTTFNLGHLLAEKGKKTLVIDADPQCNMTELMMSKMIETVDSETARTGKEVELPGSSLLEILKPRIEGDIPQIDLSGVQTVKINDHLDLIRGDVALSGIEDDLAQAHINRFSNKTHEKRTYVSIGDLITRLGDQKGYEYIFIDVGPSSGALTRSCFLAADAFLIPVSPDRFNVQAIGTLSTIIDRWITEHAQVYEDFVKIGLPVKPGKPLFLGTVSQHFKIMGGKPKPGYQMWMDRIPERVNKELLPMLKKHSDAKRNLTECVDSLGVSVTEIPDFGSLAPLMQECGKAVFQISQADTSAITDTGQPWGGGTWNNAKERMALYKNKLEDIEKRLGWAP